MQNCMKDCSILTSINHSFINIDTLIYNHYKQEIVSMKHSSLYKPLHGILHCALSKGFHEGWFQVYIDIQYSSVSLTVCRCALQAHIGNSSRPSTRCPIRQGNLPKRSIGEICLSRERCTKQKTAPFLPSQMTLKHKEFLTTADWWKTHIPRYLPFSEQMSRRQTYKANTSEGKEG